MDSKYPFAFGFLESAVHRALREPTLEQTRDALREALRALACDHGISLNFPDDVKEKAKPNG